ncbi:MAG: hypothetical protein M0Z95_14765 [Actinomycetota bacterium]|nr:hypothetical protein [Actinomycetota bacterium]
MGTTTGKRSGPGVPRVPPDLAPAPLGDEPEQPAEVLIQEARRRQRRRWAFCALVLIAAVGLVAGLLGALGGSPPTRAHHGPAIASPGEVAAFLSRAEKGFTGRFVLRYTVQYGTGRHALSGAVDVAQISKAQWAYFSTPSAQDIHATKSASAVFARPAREQAGPYSCERYGASSPWRCSSFSTAGMGTNAALLGPYPPTALLLGLQNAIAEYSGKLAGVHVTPQPAHLVVRDVDAHRWSCLAFGKPASPVALVCLDAANLIASYDIPGAVSSIAYTRAELRSRSSTVPRSALALPARPATASPVPGTPPCGRSDAGSGVRPQEIVIGCTTNAGYLKEITWQKWTGTTLDGLAELYTKNADGTFTSAQVKVALSHAGYFDGQVVFRTLSFTTATGPPQTLTDPRESWGSVTPDG